MAQSGHLKFTLPEIINRLLLKDNSSLGTVAELKATVRNYAELKELERENLIVALRKTQYKIYGREGAAELLGIKPTTLISRIKAMKIPMRP